MSAARCAGWGRIGKTLEFSIWRIPALHREAERDTTGSNSRQPLVHTWIDGRVQGKHQGGIKEASWRRHVKVTRLQQSPLFCATSLSFDSPCGSIAVMRAARSIESLASRAKYPVLLGFALLCAAAVPCSYITLIQANANEGASPQPATPAVTPTAPSEFPTASDARLA